MNSEVYNIQSGEMKLANSGMITLVLGSCVSVVIFDSVLKFGGANHYLLPERSQAGQGNDLTSLHFGDEAILHLLKEFKKRGSQPQNLVVKVIGGAGAIGKANFAIAESTLKRMNLVIQNKSVGGNMGRKAQFNPATGELKIKLLTAQDGGPDLSISLNRIEKPEILAPVTASAPKKIKVLIVDDSKPIRMLLNKIFLSDSRFEVVGEANHPLEAEELRKKVQPDIMTLDIQMPHQDGVSYLKSMNKPLAFPVIIITDFGMAQGGPVVEAMENGAFHYFQKPSLQEIGDLSEKLRETAVLAVESFKKKQASPVRVKKSSAPQAELKRPALIIIGSSTGGTEVVKEILIHLPEDAPPVLVVQHMPEHFTKAFADRLNELSQIQIKEATHGDKIQTGAAFIAPGGKQMAVNLRAGELFIKITDDPPMNRFKPSVDYLFNSVAPLDLAPKTLAIILTGMGSDGAKGMLELKNRGSYTIGQNEESCMVYGMPRAAHELGATRLMASTEEIIELMLRSMAKSKVA